MTACGTDEQSEGIASTRTAFFRLFQSVQTTDQIGACPEHCHRYSQRHYTVSKQTSFVPSDMSWDISHVRNCARKCQLTDTDTCIGQSVIHSVSRSFVHASSRTYRQSASQSVLNHKNSDHTHTCYFLEIHFVMINLSSTVILLSSFDFSD